MIKKREAKNSKRGIYIQDIELKETVFKPGTRYTYITDKENKEILIVPTKNEKIVSKSKINKVSKRKIKDGEKPVIDIRNREALALFAGMDSLEFEIFEDKVIVRGFKKEKEEEQTQTVFSKIKKVAKKVVNKVSNVIDISERLSLKQKFEVVLSKKQIEQVSGLGFQQLSIFDVLEAEDSSLTQYSSTSLRQAIDNARIPLQIASLYSGAGIMDSGFKEAGFDLVFALEYDEEAAKTYRFNLGDHIHVADIREFELNNITKAPVMIMGNPCTVFSNVNRSETRLLDHPDYLLVKRTIDAIKANENAKVFIWENVPQMLTALDGAVLEEILEELGNDFEITYGVLNAAHFGAAQLRKRCFIIGSKIGKIELPSPELQPEEFLTVGEALNGLVDTIPNQLDFSKPKADTIEKMKHVPPGSNWRSIPDYLKNSKMLSNKTHSSIYRRLEGDKPSISLPNVRKSNIMPPEGLRSLTIRECARLFGVSDSFIFKGKLSSMQQQICNAVCKPMARAIGNVVKKAIQQFNIRNGFEKLSLV